MSLWPAPHFWKVFGCTNNNPLRKLALTLGVLAVASCVLSIVVTYYAAVATAGEVRGKILQRCLSLNVKGGAEPSPEPEPTSEPQPVTKKKVKF